MNKEDKDYEVLTVYSDIGPHAAVDEAKRLFGLDTRAARLKVAWILDQLGLKKAAAKVRQLWKTSK